MSVGPDKECRDFEEFEDFKEIRFAARIFSMRLQRAFTLMEMILTLGIIAVVGALAVPSYRYYSILNDLELASDIVTKALSDARLRAQLSENDSAWGYHVALGTLYKGKNFATRDASFDELYAIPLTVTPSGLSEVSFELLTGYPSATGSIVLTAVNGEQRVILIVGAEGGITIGTSSESDRLTICHVTGDDPHTLSIPESAWPGHQSHGDYLGACPEEDDD